MKNNYIQKIIALSLSVLMVGQISAMFDKTTLALAGIGAGCVAAGVAYAYTTRDNDYYNAEMLPAEQNPFEDNEKTREIKQRLERAIDDYFEKLISLGDQLSDDEKKSVRDYLIYSEGGGEPQQEKERDERMGKFLKGRRYAHVLGRLTTKDCGCSLPIQEYEQCERLERVFSRLRTSRYSKNVVFFGKNCRNSYFLRPIGIANCRKRLFDHIITAAAGTGISALVTYGLCSAITQNSLLPLVCAGAFAGAYEMQRRCASLSPFTMVRNSLLVAVSLFVAVRDPLLITVPFLMAIL